MRRDDIFRPVPPPPPLPNDTIPVHAPGLTLDEGLEDVAQGAQALHDGIEAYRQSPGARFFAKLTSAHFVSAILTIASVQGAAILTTFPQHEATLITALVGGGIAAIEGLGSLLAQFQKQR